MSSSNIVRSDHLRQENRHRLLQTLRGKGPSSPSNLARQTGLSASSISALTNQLLSQGVVCSVKENKSENRTARGRPQTLIDLSASAGDIITLNLAIDFIQARRINYTGKTLNTETTVVSTRDMDEATLLDFINKSIKNLTDQDSDRVVRCIGVSFQGSTGIENGTLIWSPIIHQQNVPLGATLQDKFHLPVNVNNDCRIISEGLKHGHGEVLGNSFATVLFSYGVGLALYINGQPLAGVHSSALEMGHLRYKPDGARCRCGKSGCIEAYASDYGILRLAAGDSIHNEPLGRVDAAQIDKLYESAEKHDEAALEAFKTAGEALGDGLATVFTLFDTMPVALVGRGKQGVDLMQTGITSVFYNQPGNVKDIDNLLHCFDDAEPLLDKGLTHNTLAKADQLIAYSQ